MEVHRGRCGASLKTPRAGRQGSADLRQYRISTRFDVASRRGPWVRSDPNASRAPSVLFGERVEKQMKTGVPGALAKEYGRGRLPIAHHCHARA